MPSLSERLAGISRPWLLEVFAAANLALLGADIYLAHLVNDFAHRVEWYPIIFSAIVPLLLAPGILRGNFHTGTARVIGLMVGAAAIAVGVTGLVLHLGSDFLATQSLQNLVYTAPIVAPLSYVGVGMLLVLNRLEDTDQPVWGSWIVFLALGGFAGNFVLALCDHAQNGFFFASEWVPVFSAAIAVGALLAAITHAPTRTYIKITFAVMIVQALVGAAGFALHVMTNLDGPAESMTDNFVFGTPVFAPLLFTNLAALACLGLWHLHSSPPSDA